MYVLWGHLTEFNCLSLRKILSLYIYMDLLILLSLFTISNGSVAVHMNALLN